MAVEDVTSRSSDNEFISIVGTSGCGKSTFLNMVAGLIEPSGGLLTIDGVPIAGPGLDRGMVFQSYTLFPWQTVLRNVAFGLAKKGLGRKERLEVAHRNTSRWWGWAASSGPTPRSSRAACNSAWRSPAPWPTIPRSC